MQRNGKNYLVNTRTKFTNIEFKTKRSVWERDNGQCILCGIHVSVHNSNAHIVPRSKGGLGIEQNIVTLCPLCHHYLDNSSQRKFLMEVVVKYITNKYDDWDEEKLKYRKGMKYE